MNFKPNRSDAETIRSPEPEPGRDQRLDLRPIFDAAYRDLIAQRPIDDLLRAQLGRIAHYLSVPLLMLLRDEDGGALRIEASSAENLLWAELGRLPERVDGTIAGQGAAARALREDMPAWIAVEDENFRPWRDAARSEGLELGCAVPVPGEAPRRALVMYGKSLPAASRPGLQHALVVAAIECAELLSAHAEHEEQRLLAAALRRAGNAAFIADVSGTVRWCNAAFSKLSGYPREDVIGRNPRFLASGKHGARYYHSLWDTLRNGQVFRAETVDRNRDGRCYTVLQTVSPFGCDDLVTHYLSINDDISATHDEQTRRELSTGVDPITGLLHRAALENALSEKLDAGQPVTLAIVSLRGFAKAVETLGAEAGQALQSEMRARVRSVVAADAAAAMAAGEFLVQLADEEGVAQRVLEQLRVELLEPYASIGELPGLDVRFGLARAPADGNSLDTLMRKADARIGNEPYRVAHRRLDRR